MAKQSDKLSTLSLGFKSFLVKDRFTLVKMVDNLHEIPLLCITCRK